jgi:hypothetical protein
MVIKCTKLYDPEAYGLVSIQPTRLGQNRFIVEKKSGYANITNCAKFGVSDLTKV